MNQGQSMYEVAGRMFPICRSITGNGFRKSLDIIKEIHPDIKVCEVPSGTQVFDWVVPKEWNINDAYIETVDGKKLVDFKNNNLHVMGYSLPKNAIVSREELLEHIYTQPDQPDWIPYVTSYYKERWGFCMSENQKLTLNEKEYHVVIDSSLEPGSLTYGELILKGNSEDEILFSTYLCHPSMANNEISGPVLQSELIKYIKSLSKRRYSYRFVFIPETIGSITYCSRNLDVMRKNIKAGFVLSCVGDNNDYSMIATPNGNTLADRVLTNVLKYQCPNYKYYSFLYRGSDEREYCSPGIGLPVCGFCRSKYGVYPEYHTSADDMNYISPEGLQGSYDVMVKVVNALEYNYNYILACCGEPQLGKRGLYPTISQKGAYDSVMIMKNLLAYSDGTKDLIRISETIGEPIDKLIPIVDKMIQHELLLIKE